MWKEAIAAYFEAMSGICVEELRKFMKNFTIIGIST
jgi:hypothetical protein